MNVTRRIVRLEQRMGRGKGVPDCDRLQVIKGHHWERKEDAKKREAELVEKYGPECLEQIRFVHIRCFCPKCYPDE